MHKGPAGRALGQGPHPAPARPEMNVLSPNPALGQHQSRVSHERRAGWRGQQGSAPALSELGCAGCVAECGDDCV